MIIRRRHTANFTTIGNALFDDKRLAADEVGVLAWLLSRPNDWEVRRPALMRRWEIGAVSCKRIFNNWLRTGWAHARKTRLSNGTFRIVYEIRDEPGHELTDEEIREALSLVSSEAVDDESPDDSAPDHPPVTEHPPPCQRGVVDQGVVDGGVVSKKEHLLNPDSPNPDSPKRVRAFAEVQREWPIEHVLSGVTAEAAYAALIERDRLACDAGLKPYLADCKAQNRKVCDLTTFIRERRWERFAKQGPAASYVVIKPHTPQWHRWKEYRAATGQSIALMEAWERTGQSITQPSEWPPPIPKRDDAA